MKKSVMSEIISLAEKGTRPIVIARQLKIDPDVVLRALMVREDLKEEFTKAPVTKITSLMDKYDCSYEEIEATVESLVEDTGLPVRIEGSYILYDKQMNTIPKGSVEIGKHKKSIKLGLVSDTHLCSKYQQITLLHHAYDMFEKEGVDFAFHAGDVFDGSPTMHKGIMHEQFYLQLEDQVDYAIKTYPKKKFKTYVRRGNHDHSWIKNNAGDPVRMLTQQRSDLIYMPEDECTFMYEGKPLISLEHPSGGSPYAASYRSQKIFEAKLKKEDEVPKIIAVGHLHIVNYTISKDTHILQVPSFQSQTPYLRDKALVSNVGYIIIDIKFDSNYNTTEVSPKIVTLDRQIVKNDY